MSQLSRFFNSLYILYYKLVSELFSVSPAP